MKTNPRGVDLIKSFEQLKLNAYPDPLTGAAPFTIGWGHTGDVKPGDAITEHQAEAILSVDLAKAEAIVEHLGAALNENQFSALVSLAFNTGHLRFPHMRACIAAGDWAGAAEQFKDITNGGVRGLVRRRAAEVALFLEAP